MILTSSSPIRAQPLIDDIRRYETFGVHRYGSAGAKAALDWIAGELRKTGLKVSEQHFTMDRQYDFQQGALTVDGRRLDVMPQWWPPEGQASFSLTARLGPGGFARIALPFDRGAYLNDGHRAKLADAFASKPQAVLLSVDYPSGEIFAYNVDQASPAWPLPVLLVAPSDRPVLDTAERTGSAATIEIAGRYRQDVEGRNIVARLDRGTGKWLVVSTPVTSWFTSTCERGPGIAAFLATARWAVQKFAEVDLLFVATAGHEIGHGGMAHFLKDGAPPAAQTLAWAHFGSSLACRDTVAKAIGSSASLAPLVDRHFAGVEGVRLRGEKAAIGELLEIHAAGYANFFGMAGSHKFFHTPADDISSLSTEHLDSVAEAFAATLAASVR